MKTLITLLCLSTLLAPARVHAWSDHGLLTREALSVLKELQGVQATYVPLESIVPKLKLAYNKDKYGPAIAGSDQAIPLQTTSDLNLYLQIKKDSSTRHGFVFEPRLNEKTGKKISALEVLSHYTDEPDGWADHHHGDEPDTFLFEEGQYPDLWKNEYEMMGGKEGTASQAFRHMWWGPWKLANPISTFKLPGDMIRKPMGTADERLLIYVELSRAAKKAGSLYWQLRFLANGLHFMEDCTQPFHVSQTPSKKFIWMASVAGRFKGASFKMNILTKRTTQLVSYYHFAYEDFIGRIFKNPESYPKAYNQFSSALKKRPVTKKIDQADVYLTEVAKASIIRAPVAAKTAIAFFPKIPKDTDLTFFDPKEFMNDAWWAAVEASSEQESKAQRKYFNSVKESFALFGESVRSVVKTELTN